MIWQMDAGIENDVGDLVTTFDNLVRELGKLDDGQLKTNLLKLAKKAKDQALRLIKKALPSPELVHSRVRTGGDVNSLVEVIGGALLEMFV